MRVVVGSYVSNASHASHALTLRMKIIFFDGNCPMCHAWIKLIIRMDWRKAIRFSSLQGDLAQRLLNPVLPDYIKEDTIVFYDEGKIALRSDAGLKIVQALGFPYNLGIVGYIIPKKWRDGGYRWLANRRYRFGKRYDSCPLPPVKWRDRFI